MAVLKIANINAEWMVHFFRPNTNKLYVGASRSRGLGSKPKDVPQVCERLAGVIQDLDADIIGIEEGPPKKAQMQAFVKTYLGNQYNVFSMPDGRQSNYALVRKRFSGLTIKQMPGTHPIYRHLGKKLEYFKWGDVKKEKLQLNKFTRKPVVLRISKGRKSIEILVFHSKSKISKLQSKKQYTRRDRPLMIDALRSRQKLSAEMDAIRRYISHAILSKRTQGIIVMGDLNDGPHRDVFEKQFLIHNIIDELRGGFEREMALMHHTFRQEFLEGNEAFTAQFKDPTQDGKRVKVMLDHILVTTSIKEGKGTPIKLIKNSGMIEHEAYENHLKNTGRKREERACDHRPVSARFKF